MEEWEGERCKDIGIKRMKGYKFNLKIDKLKQKRDKFWSKKNEEGNPNYKIWLVINQAWVYDEYRTNALLEQYNLTTYEGCINHIVDKKGQYYIDINNAHLKFHYQQKTFLF